MSETTLNLHLTLFTPTRQEMLSLWLARNGHAKSHVASAMCMSNGALWDLLCKETIPTYRFNALLEFGIPEVLLPKAKDIPPGPKPGAKYKKEKLNSVNTVTP